MKLAIIGSRNLDIDLSKYLPNNIDEIISGGAKGIDTCAKNYALNNNIKLIEFLPNYIAYGKKAPLIRNDLIVQNSDIVYAFWDGKSKGTAYVIQKCIKENKGIKIFKYPSQSNKTSSH